MTVLQLEAAVAAKKETGAQAAIEQDSSPTTKVSFALHADQKETVRNALEKAKELSGTASDTVALEMLAAEFLGKPVQSIATPVEVQQEAAPSLAVTVTSVSAEVFKAAGVMAVLEAFEAAFPDVELEVKLPPQ